MITLSAIYWPRTRKASATAAQARAMKAAGGSDFDRAALGAVMRDSRDAANISVRGSDRCSQARDPATAGVRVMVAVRRSIPFSRRVV